MFVPKLKGICYKYMPFNLLLKVLIMKLTIELVPKTSWFKNVRSEVSSEEWDIIRRKVYERANYRCEICGGIGNKHPVECHEIWEYNIKTGIQKLIDFIALCPDCHAVKHIGFATQHGRNKDFFLWKHFLKVNNSTLEEADRYLNYIRNEYAARSQINWELDISIIKEYLSGNKKFGFKLVTT